MQQIMKIHGGYLVREVTDEDGGQVTVPYFFSDAEVGRMVERWPLPAKTVAVFDTADSNFGKWLDEKKCLETVPVNP